MVSSKIRLLAMDIDGTLVDPSGKIDEGAKEIWKKLIKKKDIITAIITSRPLEGVSHVFIENGIKDHNLPFLVIAEEREIYTFNKSRYLPLSEEWNNWIIKEEKRVLPNAKKLLGKWAKDLRKKGLKFFPVSEEIEKKRGYSSLLFSDFNQAEIARKYVKQELASLDSPLRIERPARCLDLRSKKTGKGKALKKALEILGIEPGGVLCIGDSHNDLEMLDGSFGFKSACPHNGEDIVKEAVLQNDGYIAKRSYGEGVREIIERSLKDRSEDR